MVVRFCFSAILDSLSIKMEPQSGGRYTTPFWWRELDLNQRPFGYEPNELPGCSIPRHNGIITQVFMKIKSFLRKKWIFLRRRLIFATLRLSYSSRSGWVSPHHDSRYSTAESRLVNRTRPSPNEHDLSE